MSTNPPVTAPPSW